MLHLAGIDTVGRALEELTLFEEEGLDAVIVENYHGNVPEVKRTLAAIQERGTTLQVGVNILRNDYRTAFQFAKDYGASFIQLDFVAGFYTQDIRGLHEKEYLVERNSHPEVMVLGGVWPKYYTPIAGSDLGRDLRDGMRRADGVVVTGAGTGEETPYNKILQFRQTLQA